jgi:uncharacterized ferritin-like protein (DUF455 family)
LLNASLSLREQALQVLLVTDADAKAMAARALPVTGVIAAEAVLSSPAGVPGRPAQPPLVHPSSLKPRDVKQRAGRCALLHALAHIEFNAINLALDAVWRFAGMPDRYYSDWLLVAREEALHFQLLRAHLLTLYGDLPAHDGLWDMVERTQGDVLARMALVPRTLEARGLDAAPPIRAKLAAAGDAAGAAILDIILRDEVGHVAIGNHWYRHLCDERGLDPVATYASLAKQYRAPNLRGPFNLEARRRAGFDQAELDALLVLPQPLGVKSPGDLRA